MRRSSLVITIVVVALLAAFAVVLVNRQPDPSEQSATQNTPSPAGQQSAQTETEPVNEQQNAQTTNQTQNSVEIINNAFNPANITVKKGATVTWTNKDSDEHTVTPDQESANFTGSGMLGKNETYSFTFNETGTYSYHCQPHPHMRGTVTVTE